MMFEVQCLDEVASSVPNHTRTFNLSHDGLFVDGVSIQAVRVFNGVVNGEDGIGSSQRLAEIMLSGGLCIVTILDKDTQDNLGLDIGEDGKGKYHGTK